ncbi:MAG TPA: cell division protein SepF [Candidatus Lumbricidophila sp.]|nr:cell division protein SepF [Candidatus Lumbricidophila sp.]
MSNPLKKTMAYLGLVEEDLETEQQRPVAPVAPAQQRAAAVTPLRKQAAAPTQQAEMNEILTVHPRQYRDAQVIAEAFRDGVPVIINLSQMADGDAKRLIDFASGLSQGLYGRIERVTNKVFLLSPAHVAISGEAGDVEGDVDASFFSRG